MLGFGHEHDDKPEADPIPPGAEAAKPIIDEVPAEIGGEQVRKDATEAQAGREAAMAERDANEVSIGPSTVKSVAPATPDGDAAKAAKNADPGSSDNSNILVGETPIPIATLPPPPPPLFQPPKN